MTPTLDPRRVQAALVCMHLDPAYAAAVAGTAPLPELTPAERALLRDVDPRALAADHYRRARAVQALVEEYPVTTAVVGVPVVDAFFSSPEFRACVFEPGFMALSFGTWLGDRAGGPGRIEAAIARARRPGASETSAKREGEPVLEGPAPAPGLACHPRLAPLLVPAGSLACLERIRARLGPDPTAALATARVKRERPPRSARTEALLIEAGPGSDVSLGTASEALVRLLMFAAAARTRDELGAEAIRRGADPDEVEELLAGLVADGMLVAR